MLSDFDFSKIITPLECPQLPLRMSPDTEQEKHGKPFIPVNGHVEGLEHLLAQALYWLKFNSRCVQVQVALHGVSLLLLRCNLYLREGVQRTISKTEPQISLHFYPPF